MENAVFLYSFCYLQQSRPDIPIETQYVHLPQNVNCYRQGSCASCMTGRTPSRSSTSSNDKQDCKMVVKSIIKYTHDFTANLDIQRQKDLEAFCHPHARS